MLEKTLTPHEMCYLLIDIQATGFYDVRTDNSRKPGDPLYTFPADVEFSVDGPEYRILDRPGGISFRLTANHDVNLCSISALLALV